MIPIKKACEMTVKELGAYIDQSVLKPEFTEEEIRKYIKEGVKYHCATVCINPSALDIAKEMTKGTDTKICVVCDFPFGLSSTESKVLQAEEICKKGDVFEVDVVANYGWIKSGKMDLAENDIKAVADVCHKYGAALKVILETDALTMEEIINGTKAVAAAGADFVKSSTGFFTGAECVGASPEIVKLMMDAAEGRIKVKGSGGIRTREHFLALIDMGIDRMGIGYRSTAEVLGLENLF